MMADWLLFLWIYAMAWLDLLLWPVALMGGAT